MVYRFDGERVLRLIASGNLDAAQTILDEAAKAAVAPWADIVTPEDFEAAMLEQSGAQTILEAAVILTQPELQRERLEATLCRALVANRREDAAALLKAMVDALDDGVTLDSLSDETFDAFSNLAYVGHAPDAFQQWRIAMNAARTFLDRGDAGRARSGFARVPAEENDNDTFKRVYRDLGDAIDAMER